MPVSRSELRAAYPALALIAERLEPALPAECSTCLGACVVAVAGPDENGQYDTIDCPDCSAPRDEEAE